MVVAWISFLALASDQAADLAPHKAARLAFEAEVLEFNEAGGMMDQFSTALGGVIALKFEPELRIERLQAPPGSFVLGDSREPKDTQRILARVKNGVLAVMNTLKVGETFPPLLDATPQDVTRVRHRLSEDEHALLLATVCNHAITQEALDLLRNEQLDEQRFGTLLNRHHRLLREGLKISTPKIDAMIDAALSAGALGGKINGSGGGGCMFAYAPRNTGDVAEAIERAGGKAYIVSIDDGMRREDGA